MWPVEPTEEATRHVCQQCGGLCCKPRKLFQELHKLSPALKEVRGDPPTAESSGYVTEVTARVITRATGKKRQEFLNPDPPATLRIKENGDCIFFSEEEGCQIYPIRPEDCKLWPERSLVFTSARVVMRMPLDLPFCILSQILIWRAVIQDNGGIQYTLPEPEGDFYWKFVFDALGEPPKNRTEETRRAYMGMVIYRLYFPPKIGLRREKMPRGTRTRKLASLPKSPRRR